MNPSFDLDEPDHFTAGAVGRPGERVFYIQGRQDRRLVTLKAEKEHVRALGEYLAGLLTQLEATAVKPAPDAGLQQPLEPAWDVGSLGLGYDETRDRIIIVANEVSEADDEEEVEETIAESESETAEVEQPEPDAAVARFAITRAQAAAFTERARTLMKGGRPACPMCSQPLEDGHVCPRANGHFVH